MQNRRGRILQGLSALNAESRLSESQAQASRSSAIERPQLSSTSNISSSEAIPKTSSDTDQARLIASQSRLSSRGRINAALMQARALQAQENVQPKPYTQQDTSIGTSSPLRPRTSSNSSSRNDSTSDSAGPRLSRQNSDVSSASVLSQHFQKVEKFSEYKANLSKEPSKIGQPIKITTNYLDFFVSQGCSVEEYHVDFKPNIESVSLKFKVLRQPEFERELGKVIHWTGTNLFLPHKLSENPLVITTKHPVTNERLQVTLVYVKQPNSEELIPFYNGLMRKAMSCLKMVLINRNYYSNVGKMVIDAHQIEVWPGWIASIQNLDGGIKLSVDASYRILRSNTAYDVMCMLREAKRGNLKEEIEAALIGTTVLTRYNNKAYRIDEVAFDKNPSHTFTYSRPGGESQTISYADYLKSHWNIVVRDTKQPLLVHRPKFRRDTDLELILLVPECCVVTGLTESMRQDFNLMRNVAEVTRVKPDIREQKLHEFIKELQTNERAKKVFSDWNLKIAESPEVLNARKIENLSLLMGDNREVQVPFNADWTRDATSKAVYKSVDFINWAIIYCDRDSMIAQSFMSMLKAVTRDLRIKIAEPRELRLDNEQTKFYLNAIKQNITDTMQMVVLITPGKSQRADRYSACKEILCREIPVPSQFVRAGTISNDKRLKSIVQKVALQMLCKVGGQPWAMKLPMKSFMIVGIDVYHDTLDKKRSCVAFVASTNATVSQWWSKVFFQNTFEEICSKLKQTMIEAIKRFHAQNNFIPDRVIIYRDGVGDGQLEAALNVEVAQMIDGVKFYLRGNLPGDVSPPKFSYIIVNKKINAKLMLKSAGGTVNPSPGSFLDHTITHRSYNDFYLISQHVTQGTVSPTKYIVLTETGNLKLENHCKLAYMMCHMYYNWTGTIKVPAPCQYAHKLAYLAGESLQSEPSSRLDNKLYYL